MEGMRLHLLFIIVVALLGFSPRVFSASEIDGDLADEGGGNRSAKIYDLPATVAIQPRKYEMPKSLAISAGYMPVDSFNHAFSFSGAYRYAVTGYLTWEVISFTYVMNQETDLKHQLQDLGNQNVGINIRNVGLGGVLDYPRQVYMTGIHYAPAYSKSLLFNSKVTYSETSFFLGVGALNFNQIGYKSMIAPGLTSRFYMTPGTALIGYFRDFFYKDDVLGLTGILDFGLGLEFKFGG